eukprot:CAMPEP_0171081106 /NCGR_PEP_ID=MMETSP0766_2-20121228/16301_1 /TAXON_ID=439317 /ORGANISM="Gambierdiscus australes, Strain CAWD 149" /LENGTH=65 /DNA_ID=CAMNT_0011538395 /DNA_START=103 /DNA_END=297 /DNA_ORIENTATION=+
MTRVHLAQDPSETTAGRLGHLPVANCQGPRMMLVRMHATSFGGESPVACTCTAESWRELAAAFRG